MTEPDPDLDVSGSISIPALLESTIDHMLEGFQIIDRNWRYVYVNQTVADQGKSTKEALTGRTMMECYPGINQTPLFDKLQACMHNRTNDTFVNQFTYPDGTTRWFKLFLHPIDIGLVIFSIDVTDQKHIEDQLYQKINEVNTLITSTINRETKMVELKQEIEKLHSLIPT